MSPELHDGWLRVHFEGRGYADFHYRWLRHNCDQDLHPTTRERMLCSSELPDDLRTLPGHGPETVVGRERASNPFLVRL